MPKLNDLEQLCQMLQQLDSDNSVPSHIKVNVQKALQNRIAEYHLNYYLGGILEDKAANVDTDLRELLAMIARTINLFLKKHVGDY